MKLYECKKGDIVKVVDTGDFLILQHVDGEYSYCLTLEGKVYMPSSSVEVLVVGRQGDR